MDNLTWRRLSVEYTDSSNCFLGKDLFTPFGSRGVYGGQVFAQALVASTLTVDRAKFVHSMHGYFLRAAHDSSPVEYHVEVLRDGKSYATREVKAMQDGKLIFVALVSFHIEEQSSFSHQINCPAAQRPENIMSELHRIRKAIEDPRVTEGQRQYLYARLQEENILENRYCRRIDPFKPVPQAPKQMTWFTVLGLQEASFHEENETRRTVGHCVHQAAIAYASDLNLLYTAVLPHRWPNPDIKMVTSLDHTIWFHRPSNANDWHLYEFEGPNLEHGRGFSNGRIFNSHGKLIASTSQEGVIRTFLSNEQKSESSTTQSIPMNDKKAMYSSGYAKSAIDGATTEQRWIELGVANHTRALDAKL